MKKVSETFFTVNDEQGHGDNKVKEKSNFIMSLSHFSSILVYFCKKSAGVELKKGEHMFFFTSHGTLFKWCLLGFEPKLDLLKAKNDLFKAFKHGKKACGTHATW